MLRAGCYRNYGGGQQNGMITNVSMHPGTWMWKMIYEINMVLEELYGA